MGYFTGPPGSIRLPREARIGKYVVSEDGTVHNQRWKLVHKAESFEKGKLWAELSDSKNRKRRNKYKKEKLKGSNK